MLGYVDKIVQSTSHKPSVLHSLNNLAWTSFVGRVRTFMTCAGCLHVRLSFIHSSIHLSNHPSIHPFIPLFVCYMCSPRVRYIQSWMLPVRRPPVCCCCQRHENDLTSQPQNISRHVKGKGVGLPFCAQRMVSFNINGNVHEATGSIQC